LNLANKILSILKLSMFLGLAVHQSLHAESVEVALAGLAYSGSASTISNRFPYTQMYEEQRKVAGAPIFQEIYQGINKSGSENISIKPQIDELKGKDQALVTALVLGSETVSIEQFGQLNKLMVLIRGQAMFFDFKSMNIVRSYPISFAYVDLLDHTPSKMEILERVKLVYEGANDKPGLINRFVNTVAKAKLPRQVSRYVQITEVQIKPDALNVLPDYIKSEPGAVETWAADLVGEAISTRAGIPIVPYAKGYAIGNVMSLRVSDGAVWELKLPKPDYEMSVEFSGFKKVKFSEVEGGATSFVYGAYSGIKIQEPLTGKVFLEAPLKNGETSVIPASQKYVDDFPHFYNALNLTFVKLAQILDGKVDEKWIKSATSVKNIDQQISQTKELIKLCK